MKIKILILIIGLSCFGAMAQTNDWKQAFIDYNMTNQLETNGFYSGDLSGTMLTNFWYVERNPKLIIDGQVTNFIVPLNYTGTIQVGTNFYTVKDLIVRPNNFDTNKYWIQQIPFFGVNATVPSRGSDLDIWSDSTGKSGVTFKHFWP